MSALEKPRCAQHVEGRIVQLFRRDAEGLVQNSSPSVHWLNTNLMSKAEGSAAFDLLDLSHRPKPLAASEVWLMPAPAQRAVADRVGLDLGDLGFGVAEHAALRARDG
jgi:hypothetical protein